MAKEAALEVSALADIAPPKLEESERSVVADFASMDLSGKIWHLTDLRGKIVYVNIWTTWCGPCRGEMPALQQLYERWKDRKDRVVLTISADTDVALARAFIKENQYSFPVIWGKEIAEKFFPLVYFPQNWFLDAQGRRVAFPAPRASDSTLVRIDEQAERIAAAK